MPLQLPYMYSPHLMNGNFLIMLSILPYHAMRFPCIIHYFYNILLSSEIYNCANTVGVGIIGDTSSVLFLQIGFLLSLIQLLLLLYYVTYLHYIIYFSNIKVFFLKIIKTEQFRSVFINLLSEEQFLYTIEL